MDSEPLQIFVKNEQGQIWGPLSPSTIELMLDNGILKGRGMVSKDGERYALPGRFPDLRDSFPRELGGVDVPLGESSPPPSPPVPMTPASPMPAVTGSAPRAGPG